MVPRQRIERERPVLVVIGAPPDSGGDLVIDWRTSVVQLHRTHSATVNRPRPSISVSASASRIRLRPRNASRPPWARPASQAARPSSTSASTPSAARNDFWSRTSDGGRHGELIERDLAGDVLLPEVAERRAAPLVAAIRAQPVCRGPSRHLHGRGHVVEDDDTRGELEHAAQPVRRAFLPRDPRSRGGIDDGKRWRHLDRQQELHEVPTRRPPPPIRPPSARASAQEGCRAARSRAPRPRRSAGAIRG